MYEPYHQCVESYTAALLMAVLTRFAPPALTFPLERITLRAFAPELAVLGGWWALHAWLLWVWLLIDVRPARWDESIYFMQTEFWRQFFLHPSPGSLAVAFTTHAWKSPPFWPGVMGFFQAIFGPDVDHITWISGSLAIGLLIACTYGIGRQLYGRFAGVWAAIVVSSYTGVVFISRLYLMDVQLVAMVSLAILGLVWTMRPGSGFWGLLLAAVLLGLAALTRWQAPFFLWLPTLYVIGWRFRRDRQAGLSVWQASRQLLLVCGAFGLGVLVIAGPLFAINMDGFLDTASRFVAGPPISPNSQRYQISYYVNSWLEFQFLDQYRLLVLAGVGLVVSAFYFRFAAGFLLSWIVGGYLIIAFLVKDPRYDMPYVPAFALLSCAPLALAARHRWPILLRPRVTAVLRFAVAAVLLGALSLYALAGITWHTFGVRDPRQSINLALSAPDQVEREVAESRRRNRGYGWAWQWPAPQSWHDREIVRLLDQARQSFSMSRANVAFLPSVPWMQPDWFRYLVMVSGEPLQFSSAIWTLNNSRSREALFSADMVLAKNRGVRLRITGGADWEQFSAALYDPKTDLGKQFARRFVPFARRPLPDGSEAVLYARPELTAPWNGVRDLHTAQISVQPGGMVEQRQSETLDKVDRSAVFMHPAGGAIASSATYPIARVPDNAKLTFSIGLQPRAWRDGKSDGVEFTVELVSEGRTAVLFHHYLDPRQADIEQGWMDVEVDLSAFAGRAVELRLMTSAGPAGDNLDDRALWGEPLLTPLDLGKLESLGP